MNPGLICKQCGRSEVYLVKDGYGFYEWKCCCKARYSEWSYPKILK